MKVYVAEHGLYEERMVAGIYDSPERAIAAEHKPGMAWTRTTWTRFTNWPDRSAAEHWTTWTNDRDWQEHVEITEHELVDVGASRPPDLARVQTYRESDGGWDYGPEPLVKAVAG